MVNGPTAGSATSNFPRGIETSVEWTTEMMRHIFEQQATRVEVTREAELAWTDHIREMYSMLLVHHSPSWMNGYNSNVEGYDKGDRFIIYAGGLPRYRSELDECAQGAYAEFVLE